MQEQVENAITANDLKCGHKGKCSHCPTCKRFNDDGIGEVRTAIKRDYGLVSRRRMKKQRDHDLYTWYLIEKAREWQAEMDDFLQQVHELRDELGLAPRDRIQTENV